MVVVTLRYRSASEYGASSAPPARTKHSAVLNTIGVKPGSTRTRSESCIAQPSITVPPMSTSSAPTNPERGTRFIALISPAAPE